MLPFGTIWTELEGIILSEISQRERETKTYMSHQDVESWGKTSSLDREQTEVGEWGMGEIDERSKGTQTSSYATTYPGNVMYHIGLQLTAMLYI